MTTHHNILLACMAKSGSTYLRAIISGLPNFRIASWVPGHGRREQELCKDTIIKELCGYPNSNQIAQLHVRYSDVTERYVQEFELKPVVLVRNILDVIPSLLDHHKSESTTHPFAYVPKNIVDWDNNRAAEFTTNMIIPWYLNFYASWNNCEEKVLLCYEDLIKNPKDVIKKICSKWNIQVSDDEILHAIKRAAGMNTRMNIGQPGRGASVSNYCKQHILKLASYYEDVDFSIIGIGKKENSSQRFYLSDIENSNGVEKC